MDEITDEMNPNVEPQWRRITRKTMETLSRVDGSCDREESEVEVLARALVRADRLLSSWAGFSKALRLYEPNGELSDFDDELADDVQRTAQQTMEWRDGPGTCRF